MRNLPEVFPGAVLVHALSRPFLPATPRRSVDCIGATTRSGPTNSLARSLPLAARRKDGCGESEFRNRGHGSVFGRPQRRFANQPIRRAPAIVVCAGSPYFGSAGIVTFGATGAQIITLTWHSCCVAAWNLWIAPSDHVRHLKVLQNRRCLATGERLIKNAEVDHRVPLFKVGRDYRDTPWPALLAFWGVPNLQVINRSAQGKCAKEAGERRVRLADRSPDIPAGA